MGEWLSAVLPVVIVGVIPNLLVHVLLHLKVVLLRVSCGSGLVVHCVMAKASPF